MQLIIDGIRKKYHHNQVLDGVSLRIESGEQVGILGQNGCGKSTLLAVLAGILSADAGRFLVQHEGREPMDLLDAPALRSRLVGYVPQDTPLLEELSALDNLRLWYPGGRRVLEKELESGVLRDLGIEPFLNRRVSRLSGGMKKRLSIGCALAHHPRILLLDEPGAALDLVCKQIIVDYLDIFCREGGIVLMASHEIPEIASCTRTLILKDGTVRPYAFDGSVSQLVSHL